VLLAGQLAGCDANQITVATGQDIAAAFRDPAAAFDQIRTYALADSVVHLTRDRGEDHPMDLPRSFDAQILASVARHLDERGFSAEPDPAGQRPDVIVLVGVIASPEFTAWVSYPWYSWWEFFGGLGFFNGWDANWSIAYAWSDAIPGYQYDPGSLVIEMLDVRNIDFATRQVVAVWGGTVNGVLAGPAEDMATRLARGIDEIFRISPYLTRAP
jgi:hypothetical protein